MIFKTPEEHLTFINSCIDDIHSELNRVLYPIVEDRKYQPTCSTQGPIDFGFLKRLFDRLIDEALPALQKPDEAQAKAIKTKAFASVGAFGNVPVSACMALVLRILRLSPTHSPKQARVEKQIFDEVVSVAGNELHGQAWRLVEFLASNVEGSVMTGFEAEMADLCAERLRSDLKSGGLLSMASRRALQGFERFASSQTGFNGSLFVRELAKSGVLSECCQAWLTHISSFLKRGLVLESPAGEAKQQAKRARYHQQQLAQSEKDRLAAAQVAFEAEVADSVALFMQATAVFDCGQGALGPEEHCKLAESLIGLQVSLQRSAHNFPFLNFAPLMAQIYGRLVEAAVAFQPAFLPPFLAQVMRILAAGAHAADEAGWTARRGLLRIETLVHPRRKGPLVFRVVSESVSRVFAIDELSPVVQPVEQVSEPTAQTEQVSKETFTNSKPLQPVEPKPLETKGFIQPIQPAITQPFIQPVKSVSQPVQPIVQPVQPKPVQTKPSPMSTPMDEDDDDEPLPQIIDCEPDE